MESSKTKRYNNCNQKVGPLSPPPRTQAFDGLREAIVPPIRAGYDTLMSEETPVAQTDQFGEMYRFKPMPPISAKPESKPVRKPKRRKQKIVNNSDIAGKAVIPPILSNCETRMLVESPVAQTDQLVEMNRFKPMPPISAKPVHKLHSPISDSSRVEGQICCLKHRLL
ncbi:uncharacterized protein [Antedon mediterranea]|uniref:uncharacterized protein n=1 Tax=Antedon mediterranea TaxID=105859 RepID=UPI003AF95061